jgi:hypothetical protein
MHPIDVLIVVAESLPEKQGLDLVGWWMASETEVATRNARIEELVELSQHPSMKWYVLRHIAAISALYNERYPINRH